MLDNKHLKTAAKTASAVFGLTAAFLTVAAYDAVFHTVKIDGVYQADKIKDAGRDDGGPRQIVMARDVKSGKPVDFLGYSRDLNQIKAGACFKAAVSAYNMTQILNVARDPDMFIVDKVEVAPCVE